MNIWSLGMQKNRSNLQCFSFCTKREKIPKVSLVSFKRHVPGKRKMPTVVMTPITVTAALPDAWQKRAVECCTFL